MELLILSKLKWDLTAITAYDYLDHLLVALQSNSSDDDDGNFDDEDDHCVANMAQVDLDSLRRQTERLMTLCATEPDFLSLAPSTLASASLASAAQHDLCSRSAENVALVDDIFLKIHAFTKVEMVSDKE